MSARTSKPNFALYSCAGAQLTFIVNLIISKSFKKSFVDYSYLGKVTLHFMSQKIREQSSVISLLIAHSEVISVRSTA